MQKLMKEISDRQDVILFIDEIHEIVGAGSAGDGNMDAGNILKPALARGELQLVGATTLNEYRIIEKDAALNVGCNLLRLMNHLLMKQLLFYVAFKNVMRTIIT
jgi:ATP-dependent Clp protease ATP-binding subunit ClpA